VVGDTPTGANSARAAAMRVMSYATMTPVQRLVRADAKAIATDMNEVRHLLLVAWNMAAWNFRIRKLLAKTKIG